MLKEHAEMTDLSQSGMIEKSVYSDGLTPLESLGLESAMRMAVVKGIELFTDIDRLEGDLFAGESNEEA